MYGHPHLMRAWAKTMRPKGRPGRPPVFGSRAWMLRRQAELAFGFAESNIPRLYSGLGSGSYVTPGLTAMGGSNSHLNGTDVPPGQSLTGETFP